MSKITLNNLINLQNETTAVNTINSNNNVIQAAFDNTLSRDGSFPNQMNSNLDMNSNRILNLPSPINGSEPIRLQDATSGIIIGPTVYVNAYIFSTVSSAAVATVPNDVVSISTMGYLTAGDNGGASYFRVSGNTLGGFQTFDGQWWGLNSKVVTPEMFGAVGNGTTDDFIPVSNSFIYTSSVGGGIVNCTSGKNYRIALNSSLTNRGLTLNTGVTLNLNNSQISLECTGYVYGIRPSSNTAILGPGTVKTTLSTGLTNGFGGDGAVWHAPIALGAAYGDGGTFASPSQFLTITNWRIERVTVDSVRNNGQGGLIHGFGGMSQGTVKNNIIPDNSTIAIAIGFDWYPLGLDDNDLTGSKAAYLAGTAGSLHPHDIVIESNTIGAMTMPYYLGPFGSHGIRLSGCYDIKVSNNTIESTTYCGIFSTGGDLSFEFAPPHIRILACKNMLIENNAMSNINDQFGVYLEAYPDNLYAAFSDPGNSQYPYVPLFYVDGYYTNSIIKGNRINSITGTSICPAIYCTFIKDATIEDNIIQGSAYGIQFKAGSKNIKAIRNDISICLLSGIIVDDSSVTPNGIILRDNSVHRNCLSGGTTGNIYLNFGIQTIVDSNTIGSLDEDLSSFGLVVTSNHISAIITNNTVPAVKSGGTAYNINTSTNTLNSVWVFKDNKYYGADTFFAGTTIIPVEREYSTAVPGVVITHARATRGTLSGNITPSFGTWSKGSTIWATDATSTQPGIVKCTVTGSPGTWTPLATVT